MRKNKHEYAEWKCKIPGCRTWGIGGPKGFNDHHYDKHETYPHMARLDAHIAFGFSPEDEMQVKA